MAYGDQQFLSGAQGTVKVGGQSLGIQSWSFTPESKLEDTTNTRDYDQMTGNTYESHVPTLMSGKGSFKADWDALAIPTAATPNLQPGKDVALRLQLGDTVRYIDIPHATITSLPITSEVRGRVSYTCEFTTNGKFNMPT